jgi:hypothetical protein
MTSKKNKQNRTIRTVEELQKASIALHYELWMFSEMVKFLSTQPQQHEKPLEKPLYNALVESFVQHTRNLIEFFYPQDNVHSDTIIAKDFFPDQAKWKETIPKELDEERADAHKFLAHLTYDRLKNKKNWDFTKISKCLNSVLDKFLKEVPQDRIGDKLRNYKVPPVNIIKSPIDEMFASTTEALLPGISVSRDLFK